MQWSIIVWKWSSRFHGWQHTQDKLSSYFWAEMRRYVTMACKLHKKCQDFPCLSACINIYQSVCPCVKVNLEMFFFSVSPCPCLTVNLNNSLSLFFSHTVDMQSVNTASAVQQAYREADGFQSNIPRHCAFPLSPVIQGALRIGLWAVHAHWRVASSPARCQCGHAGNVIGSMNLRHFNGALHKPGRTAHCTLLSIFLSGGEGCGGFDSVCLFHWV